MNETCQGCDAATFELSSIFSACVLQSPVDSIAVGDRTMWNIVRSSLATLITCTWVGYHPNIPGLNETWLQRKARRIKVFVIALLTPEVVVLCAIRQSVAARKMGMEMRSFFNETGSESESAGMSSILLSFELSRASFSQKQAPGRRLHTASSSLWEVVSGPTTTEMHPVFGCQSKEQTSISFPSL